MSGLRADLFVREPSVVSPELVAELHRAAAAGDVDLARTLLAAGVMVDALDTSGRTPLYVAAASACCEVVDVLLGAGADPDLRCADGTTARRQSGWGRCRDSFLGRWREPERGAPAEEFESRLVAGIWFGDRLLTEAMLARGADPDADDPASGQSMVGLAIEADHAAALRALIGAGANVNRPDSFGLVPLWRAVEAELDFSRQADAPLDLRLVRPLLEAGANPDEVGSNGESARAFAIRHGYTLACEAMTRAERPELPISRDRAITQLSFCLRRSEYVGAVRPFAVRQTYTRVVTFLGLVSLLLGAFGGRGWASLGLGCLLIAAGYVAFIPYLWWRRMPNRAEERSTSFGPDGFTVSRQGLATRGDWTEISRTFESCGAHVMESRTVFIVVPKRAFVTTDEERRFQELVREHVGRERWLGRWR